MDCIGKSFKADGVVKGLYPGFLSSVQGIIIYRQVLLNLYEVLNFFLSERFTLGPMTQLNSLLEKNQAFWSDLELPRWVDHWNTWNLVSTFAPGGGGRVGDRGLSLRHSAQAADDDERGEGEDVQGDLYFQLTIDQPFSFVFVTKQIWGWLFYCICDLCFFFIS